MINIKEDFNKPNNCLNCTFCKISNFLNMFACKEPTIDDTIGEQQRNFIDNKNCPKFKHRNNNPIFEFYDVIENNTQYTVRVETENNNKCWFYEGKFHRINAPAVETKDYIKYYTNGILNRLDGPTIIYKNGYTAWIVNDEYHRLDGPALITSEGNQYWHVNGKLHRTDGPAIIHEDNRKEYYLNNIKLTEEEFLKTKIL